jgi:hypothetical protein
MDKQILLRHLVQAEQDVAEGKAFIAKQQRSKSQSETTAKMSPRLCVFWKRL